MSETPVPTNHPLNRESSPRQTILAWLQLCRAANVFTALADIFTGYLLTHPHLGEDAGLPLPDIDAWDFSSFPQRLIIDGPFGWLLGASGCLFLAGMVFNDVFDRRIDALERPGRPIPSGRISLRGAVVLGSILVTMGLLFAGLAGWPSLFVALLLVGAIFAYDGLLKSTFVGPVVMGSCRFFNILLGASAIGGEGNAFLNVFAPPQLYVACAMGLYIVGVTWFARRETGGSNRLSLLGAGLVVNLGLGLLIALLLRAEDEHHRAFMSAVLVGAVMAVVNRRMLPAIVEPEPANMQTAIRMMLLSLLTINASICLFAHRDPVYAVTVIAMWLPSYAMAWCMAMT